MRAVLWLLGVVFVIAVGAQPSLADVTLGLALDGAAHLLAMIPPIVLLAGGVWLIQRSGRTA